MPSGGFGRSLIPSLDEKTRQEAIEDPGPSWRDWFYYSFLKGWILLALFAVDSWIIAIWLQPVNVPAMAASLAGALYAEFLLYQVLWYRTPEETPLRGFQRTWLTPVRHGLWTPEAAEGRLGIGPSPVPAGPDPREFL